MNKQKKVRLSNLFNGFLRKTIAMISLLLCFSIYANAQEITVSGTIIDKENLPIIGAIVKGGSAGTASDIDGRYQIVVDKNGTLEFTLVGYKKVVIPVQGKQTIDVTMEEDVQVLEQVVVVGYSTISKRSLTGALDVIDDKKLKNITSPSVENLLVGKAPGVQVSSASGQPGQAGKIVIRGRGSLSGSTDPLWVVDGVIMGNSGGDLNPADIENVTILKDAASTAIYGSQGANGVIQVTTKSAKEGKITINFSGKLVGTWLNNGPMEMMNGSELYDLYSSFSNYDIAPEYKDKNFDWWDSAAKTGFAHEYNLSIGGGSETVRSYASVGYYEEEGAIKSLNLKRYNLLAKLEFKPYKFLTLRPMVSGSYRKTDDRQGGAVGNMYANMPWDSPYKEDGSLVSRGKDAGWFAGSRTNYMYDQQWNFVKRERTEVNVNMDFDVKLTDWLTFASVNSYKFSKNESKSLEDPRSMAGEGAIGKGRVEDTYRNYERVYTNQLLRVNKAFGDHYINAVVGYEWNEINTKWNRSSATGIPAGFIVQEAAANPEAAVGGQQSEAVQSYLANVNYTYSDRYVGQVSFRRDGASNFGPDNRYGNFYSISAGWNIHNESFFKAKDVINNLKLRASYGSQGKRPDAAYGHLYLYNTGLNQSYNGETGVIISGYMGNRDLRWEKTFTADFGLEMSLFNRVDISFDYYHKNVSDLLYEVDLPAVSGQNKSYQNAGKLVNQGIEASIGVDIIKSEDFDWRVDANIGLNRNEIKSLYDNKEQMIVSAGDNIAGSAQIIYKPGMDSRTWWVKEWAGVDPKDGSPLWYKKDADGNKVTTNKYNEANETACGAFTPDFFGGFTTNLRYKDFDLTAVFGYSVGGKIYNYARMEYDSDGAYIDRNQMKLHNGWSRWEKEGDIATHPKPVYKNLTNSAKTSSRYLESATFLKMRSLMIGYNVPLKIKGISNLRLTVSGENLFTISHFSGVDPEVPPRYYYSNGQLNSTITGVASAVYPNNRKFVFGVNVTL